MNPRHWSAYALVALLSIVLKWTTGSDGYSGRNTPPRFGDYEAQRHWMEITTNLPLKEWYAETPDNSLEYWGLDYPPLQAYHAYLCGSMYVDVIFAQCL